MERSAGMSERQRHKVIDRLRGYVDDDLLRTYQPDDGSVAREVVEQLLATARARELKKRKARNPTITKIEEFAKGANDFLEAVKGPSDIIKGAVPMNLGNVVNGTFTLLLKVTSEKKVQDDLIAESLKDATSWLRRIDNLKASYDSIPTHFYKLVSSIYEKLIDFLCTSIRRLCSNNLKRRLVATFRPTQIKEATDALKESIADLFQDHAANQSKQMTNLQQGLSELKRIAAEKAKTDFRRNRHSVIHDTAIALHLPPRMDKDTMLSLCRQAHQSLPRDKRIHQDQRKRLPLVWGGMQMLETREKYQIWMKSESPCLLVLNGNSYGTIDQQYSWLSPVTTELYDRLMVGPSAKTLFFSGHHISGQEIKKEDRYAHIFWGIAMQALQLELELAEDLHNESLDNVLREISAKAKEDVPSNGKLATEQQLRLIQEILIAAVKHLHLEQPLYIILDGIVWDQEHSQRLAFQLAKLVLELRDELYSNDSQRRNVPIKVLAVAKYDQWPTMASDWRRNLERAFSQRLMDLTECIVDDLDCHQGKA